MKIYDCIIIGGGASGLISAISAILSLEGTKVAPSILILEKNKVVGKKLSVTGNGRCNISNINCKNQPAVAAFFRHLGLAFGKAEGGGRLYPMSESAQDVVHILEKGCHKLGVEIQLETTVTEVKKDDEFFHIRTAKGKTYLSNNCLIATGGKSYSNFGSTGDGISFGKKLGHRANPLIPVLTPIETMEDTKELNLSGIRSKGKIRLLLGNREIFSEQGEIQFTDFGISGICTFNLSRHLLLKKDEKTKIDFSDYTISIDFLPNLSREEAELLIEEQKNSIVSRNSPLYSLVKENLGGAIESQGKERNISLVEAVKDFRLTPKRPLGWKFAQVTKGGIILDEVSENMESKLVEGLFFAGEVLDFDGECGGYNLQFAWESGINAGRGIASKWK